MLIISKYKDYYDSATIMVDKETVYHRESMTYHLTDREYSFLHNRTPHESKWDGGEVYSSFVLGFCGVEYVGVVYGENINLELHPLSHNDRRVEYGENSCPVEKKRWFFGDLKESFRQVHNRENHKLFSLYDCPVYIIYRHPGNYSIKMVTNPILKDVSFGKIFDPVSTFQKIHVYLREIQSKATKEDITIIPDKDKLESKGFDKWSFRREKHPSKPRRNRKTDKNGN
jgi:hypothetical protein